MRTSVACEQCRRRKTRCDGESPCGSCRYLMVSCRFPRPKQTRPLSEQVDHIESLVERIFQESNLLPSSDEDSDGGANDTDPEFGTRRIKLSPMDDPLYNSNLAGEILSPRYQKILQQRIAPDLYIKYRDTTTQLNLLMVDAGESELGDIWSLDPAPPTEPSQHILRARELCNTEEYNSLDDSVKLLVPAKEFLDLNPKGPTAALFYGTLTCVLANDNKQSAIKGPESTDRLRFLRWAMNCGVRHAMRQVLQPASEARLRAILMLFFGTNVCWINIETQIMLSRIAVDICRDLGLHRRSVYVACSVEKQSYLASLFWFSYAINRSVLLRFGYAATMDASEISKHIPTLIGIRLVNGSKHYIDLFGIYDNLYEATCSSAAEGASVRQLVRHSLIALKDLDNWWKAVHPNWSPDANPLSILEEFNDMYQNDRAVVMLIFFTLSVFYYIRLQIFRMCALTPASVQDHLAAMFPVQVAALKESKGIATSDLQNRIAALMSPSHSIRRTGTQFLKLCHAYMRCYDQCTSVHVDVMIVTALLCVNTVMFKLKSRDIRQDSALFRKIASTMRERGMPLNEKFMELMTSKVDNYADIMDACATQAGGLPTTHTAGSTPYSSDGPTSDRMDSFELMNYDVARLIETELGDI